jgi:prepilin-type N-terminal cleavage/methylation domain-containing protein
MRQKQKKRCRQAFSQIGGFSLIEFLIAAALLTLLSGWALSALAEMQKTASSRAEMESVMENCRETADAITRIIRQAGNDPQRKGIVPISTCGKSELRVRSDSTGSGGLSNPDKGDPDGDTLDTGEDILIRHNPGSLSVETVSPAGAAQPIAGQISEVSFRYWDFQGNEAASCSDIRRITLSITAVSSIRDPKGGKPFSICVQTQIRLAPLP